MKAIVLHQPGAVRVEDRPEPRAESPTDAVVRVTCAAICGSDLHIVTGRDRGCRPGTIMGHEFVGVVEDVGSEVRNLHAGDRVVAPFTVNCGACFFCRKGLTGRCVQSLGFGFVDETGHGLPGAQAGWVRVPLADATLVPLPSTLDDRKALFLGDILSTAYGCAQVVERGDVVAVVGCGPVGLLAVQSAMLLGAAHVVAIDGVDYRRDKAASFGARAATPEDAPRLVRELTEGRGADAVLEAVGAGPALELAIDLLRPGGTISIAGYHTADVFPLPIQAAYRKNLTLKIGRCHARSSIDRLLPRLLAGELDPTAIITHTLPLSDGARAYQLFAGRQEQAIKVLLIP